MYYVLRTHGSLESHWGWTAIGAFKTKKKAEAFCKKHLKEAPTPDKLMVVKGLCYFQIAGWNVKYEAINTK